MWLGKRTQNGEDEQRDEEDVRGEMTHELDDGNLCVAMAERQRERDPHGRTDDEGEEEEENLPRAPAEIVAPHLGEIALN